MTKQFVMVVIVFAIVVNLSVLITLLVYALVEVWRSLFGN